MLACASHVRPCGPAVQSCAEGFLSDLGRIIAPFCAVYCGNHLAQNAWGVAAQQAADWWADTGGGRLRLSALSHVSRSSHWWHRPPRRGYLAPSLQLEHSVPGMAQMATSLHPHRCLCRHRYLLAGQEARIRTVLRRLPVLCVQRLQRHHRLRRPTQLRQLQRHHRRLQHRFQCTASLC